jgi:glycosyltransferase involved in cell wall biosynthesis
MASSMSSQPPVRVVHLVTSRGFAGIERHVLQVSTALGSLGCSSAIACPVDATKLREGARENGIRVLVDDQRSDRLWLARLAGTLHAVRPQVLHVHDGRAAAIGVALSKRDRLDLVRTQHFIRTASTERNGWRKWASIRFHGLVNRQVDAYVSITRTVAAATTARGESQSARNVVIPSGVALADRHAVSAARLERRADQAFNVVFAGRLEPERELDVLIRAAPRVLEQVPACRFVIAGDGSARAELERLARDVAPREAIQFPGWQPDLASVFRMAHAYVNTWSWEAFGMAMVEAMSWELPIVAADAGANRELIDAGSTGILVVPGDADQLAAALIGLAQDRAHAEALGVVGRVRAAECYGVDKTAAALLGLYDRLAART